MDSYSNPGGQARAQEQAAPAAAQQYAPGAGAYGQEQAYGAVQPYAAGQPYAPGMAAGPATGLQMKQRNPVGVWLLNYITFGIYGLVYWYKIHAELAEFDRRRHINAAWELISIWLLGWTIVLPLMSIGGLAGKIRNAQAAAGLPQNCSGGIGILLVFLFGTHIIYYQLKLDEIISANPVPPGQQIALAA